MLHVLGFALDHVDGAVEVTPTIDEVPLTDLVTAYESGLRADVVGGYGGLVLDRLRDGLADHLGAGRTAVLACDCGELGCWPLNATVEVDGGTVTWSGYEQPHRPDRDYGAFGPHRFDRAQYEEAVAALAAAASGWR